MNNVNNGGFVRTVVLSLVGFGIIAYALFAMTGCSKGPSTADKGFLKGCDAAAHAVLESMQIPPAPQANFDKVCAVLLEESKAKK